MAYYYAQYCGIAPDFSQLNLRPRRLSISRFPRNFAGKMLNVLVMTVDNCYLNFALKKSNDESSSRLAG